MAEKNAYKEGLKKAQQFAGIHKIGGLKYFCSISDIAEGNFDLLSCVLNGINSDKKAKDWAKMVLSSDDTKVIGLCHVPVSLINNDTIDVSVWINAFIKIFPNIEVLELAAEYAKFYINVKENEEIFAFKLCSDMADKNATILREKGIIKTKSKEEEEEDDECDFAAAMGIEW